MAPGLEKISFHSNLKKGNAKECSNHHTIALISQASKIMTGASLAVQQWRIRLQCSYHRRCKFDPWGGKIPWRRAWQPTPVFLPGESPWTEEPGELWFMGSQSQTRLKQLSTRLCSKSLSQTSTVHEPRTSGCTGWISKRQRDWRSNCKHLVGLRKSKEFHKNIYFCYIDYVKAFYCMDHNKLWKSLKQTGLPDHLTCLLRNLYAGQKATVRTRYETTDWFKIGKGVCQYCILSPWLFNFCAEYIMRNARLDESQLESRLLGEISTTSDMQVIPVKWQKRN